MIDYAREDTEIPVFAVGVYLSFIFQLPDFLPQPSCSVRGQLQRGNSP